MHKAMLYEKLSHSRVRCGTCQWRCNIAPGKFGVCRVYQNRGGVLYNLNYARASSVAADPIEKKPLFHLFFRLSLLQRLGFSRPRLDNLIYNQSGIELAVSRLLAVAHLGLVLKDDNLIALALPLRGSHYLGSINSGRADRHLFTVAYKQHPVQVDGLAFRHLQAFHIYGLAGAYLVLLAASFNNSVNLKNLRKQTEYSTKRCG